MVKFFGLFVLLALATACTPKIDASSTTSLVTSVAKVSATLNEEERARFRKAFLKVAFKEATDADLIDLAKNADKIMPDARKAVNGKTAEQIIAQGGT